MLLPLIFPGFVVEKPVCGCSFWFEKAEQTITNKVWEARLVEILEEDWYTSRVRLENSLRNSVCEVMKQG